MRIICLRKRGSLRARATPPPDGVPNGGWRDAAGNWRCPSLRLIKRSAPVLKWNHGVWVAQYKEEKRFSLKCVQPHCQDRLGWDVSVAMFDLLLRGRQKTSFRRSRAEPNPKFIDSIKGGRPFLDRFSLIPYVETIGLSHYCR